MKPLPLTELRKIMAAEGWAYLGDLEEATRELDDVEPLLQLRPEVLKGRRLICSKAERWDACKNFAWALLQVESECTQNWIWLAYAVSQSSPDGLKKACAILMVAEGRFLDDPAVPYFLARYKAQTRHFFEARACLDRAFKLASANKRALKELQQFSLEDPALEPLWNAQNAAAKRTAQRPHIIPFLTRFGVN